MTDTTTTYTVFNRNTGDFASADRGLSLEDAADALMTDDGYEWEWRSQKRDILGEPMDYWTIWLSDGSRYSTRSARHLRASRFAGFDKKEILEEVVSTDWRGMEAMPDDAFSAMVAAYEAEVAAEAADEE